MPINVNELREQRKNLAEKAGQILTKAADEKRDLTGEENQEWTKLHADVDKLKAQIDRAEKQATIDAEVRSIQNPQQIGRETREVQAAEKPEDKQTRAWAAYLRDGETRDLVTGTPDGDAFMAPPVPTARFIEVLRDLTPMRDAPVQVIPTTNGNDIPLPKFDDTANDADETAEGSAVDENDDGADDPDIDQVVVKAFNFDSKVVKLSRQLLQDSVIPIEQLVNRALGKRLANKTNLRYTTGNGTTQPEGITIGASNSGISLPAATLGADNAVIYQNLQAIIHSVPSVHRKAASFGLMFNDNTLLKLKQLVDEFNRPLWVASMAAGEPDMVCGVKYYPNTHMPDIGAGNRSIVVGDFSQFAIRDVQAVEVLRLVEKYAEKKMIGFLAFFRSDSRVLDSTAIKYAAHAAS